MKKLDPFWIISPILVGFCLISIFLYFIVRKNACFGKASQECSQQLQEPSLWNVYEDKDAGVTCYIYKDENISCLPTKDLK